MRLTHKAATLGLKLSLDQVLGSQASWHLYRPAAHNPSDWRHLDNFNDVSTVEAYLNGYSKGKDQ